MTVVPTPPTARDIRTAGEARAFLLDRIDYERRPAAVPEAFRLDGIRQLLDALGNPQDRIPAVHVAGTKGKGSTSAMIAAGLVGTGLRTGLFTSPHVDRIEERLRVDDREPDERTFVDLVSRVAGVLERTGTTPTFFELLTALAWVHFENERVDLAVMEVGMGGRLDSTNVCRPIATVVTNVSRDHERLLGNTLGAIAREKAGIVKPGIPCTTGVKAPEALEVVRFACRDNDVELWEADRDVTVSTRHEDGEFGSTRPLVEVTTPTARWPAFRVPLAGNHQVSNAQLAVATLERVRSSGVVAVEPERAVRGIEQLEWPLRFEIVSERPLIVCDAAHNAASVEAVVRTIRDVPERSPRVLVFASSADKDHGAMLEQVVGAFDHVVLTRFVDNPRAVPPEVLAESFALQGGGSCECRANPTEALEVALRHSGETGLVCATGSFFLAAEVRRAFRGSEANRLSSRRS